MHNLPGRKSAHVGPPVLFPFSISNNQRKKLKFNDINERNFSAYLRFEVLDKPGVLSNITSVFSTNRVSVKRLIQNPNKNKGSSSIIIFSPTLKSLVEYDTNLFL